MFMFEIIDVKKVDPFFDGLGLGFPLVENLARESCDL
jgi:hypothetical protein